MKLQELLIHWILNPLGRIMAKIPDSVRTAGFYMGGVGLFLINFIVSMGIFVPRYFLVFALGCLCLGLMILCMLSEKLRPVRFSTILSLFWFGAGILMLQAGLRLNTDNLSDAIMFLAAYPILWLVWGQWDFSKIAEMLCGLCRWSFVAFFIISLLFFPISTAQYPGMFQNVNGTGLYLALVLACLTVELWQREKQDAGFWRDLVLLGLASAMLFYTNSRTGELAILCVWLFSGILYAWSNRRAVRPVLLKRFLPLVLSVLILVPATVYLFAFVEPVSGTLSRAAYTAITAVLHPSQNDGQEPGTPDDGQHQEGPDGLQGFIQKTEQKGSVADKSADQYSTGRLSIWKEFAKHVQMFGTGGEISYYIASRYQNYGTAHNTPLEFAIYDGLFCGILYLLFNILAGLKSVYYALRHFEEAYSFLPLMVTLAFGVCSMVGSLKTPFYYMISMYYFFVQTPLMTCPQCSNFENSFRDSERIRNAESKCS